MALLNRRLTDEEVQMLTGGMYVNVAEQWPRLWESMFGPFYQTVRYRAALDRVDYEDRDTFYGMGPQSPSDRIWMVPHGLGALVAR